MRGKPIHELGAGWEVGGTGRDRLLAGKEFRNACRVGAGRIRQLWLRLTRPAPLSSGAWGRPAVQGIPPSLLTKTSAKMSPAYSRSPCSPSAPSASSSPGGAHDPGGLSRRLREALVPSGTTSGTVAPRGSGSREAAGLCRGDGLRSAPAGRPKAGGGTPVLASHQHPPDWRQGRNRAPTPS